MSADRRVRREKTDKGNGKAVFSGSVPGPGRGGKLEEALADAKPGDKFQFVRTGFFTPDSKNPGVYNRVVTLRDSFKPAK